MLAFKGLERTLIMNPFFIPLCKTFPCNSITHPYLYIFLLLLSLIRILHPIIGTCHHVYFLYVSNIFRLLLYSRQPPCQVCPNGTIYQNISNDLTTGRFLSKFLRASSWILHIIGQSTTSSWYTKYVKSQNWHILTGTICQNQNLNN